MILAGTAAVLISSVSNALIMDNWASSGGRQRRQRRSSKESFVPRGIRYLPVTLEDLQESVHVETLVGSYVDERHAWLHEHRCGCMHPRIRWTLRGRCNGHDGLALTVRWHHRLPAEGAVHHPHGGSRRRAMEFLFLANTARAGNASKPPPALLGAPTATTRVRAYSTAYRAPLLCGPYGYGCGRMNSAYTLRSPTSLPLV